MTGYCFLSAVPMRSSPSDKAEMVNVQKRIADKKAAAQQDLYEKELHKGDPANA